MFVPTRRGVAGIPPKTPHPTESVRPTVISALRVRQRLYIPGAERVCERSDILGGGAGEAGARGADGPPTNLRTRDANRVMRSTGSACNPDPNTKNPTTRSVRLRIRRIPGQTGSARFSN